MLIVYVHKERRRDVNRGYRSLIAMVTVVLTRFCLPRSDSTCRF